MDVPLKIIECPRDAMQGRYFPIATELKRRYINSLLKVGYDTLDFGSFVSPKAVPQMADTAQVLAGLDLNDTPTKLLAIVANHKGAEDACGFEKIHYVGYPFSLSPTFQHKNTRQRIEESWDLVQSIQEMVTASEKELVIYFSMGFGNPYGDEYNEEIVEEWADKMERIGVKIISLADTIGTAEPELITPLMSRLIQRYPQVEFGAHFHSRPESRHEKIAAAWDAGCRRIDVAILGFGGCPFAHDELVGNIATESLLTFLEERGIESHLDVSALRRSFMLAGEVFARD
jgi:hydroxymethylglutaryl-CoA lyase